MAHLTIIRGLPGSGKTTFGRRIAPKPELCFSADDYMTDERGIYTFDATKLPEAHAWCYQQVVKTLDAGIDCVVANTFVRRWEMQPYIDYCNNNQHEHTIIVMAQQYKSIHNVPDHVIQRMNDRWEW